MKKNTFEKLIKEKAGVLSNLKADDIEKMAASIEKLSVSLDKIKDAGLFEENDDEEKDDEKNIEESNNILLNILIEAETPKIKKKDLLDHISSQ